MHKRAFHRPYSLTKSGQLRLLYAGRAIMCKDRLLRECFRNRTLCWKDSRDIPDMRKRIAQPRTFTNRLIAKVHYESKQQTRSQKCCALKTAPLPSRRRAFRLRGACLDTSDITPYPTSVDQLTFSYTSLTHHTTSPKRQSE
jgi:hypothetical protein